MDNRPYSPHTKREEQAFQEMLAVRSSGGSTRLDGKSGTYNLLSASNLSRTSPATNQFQERYKEMYGDEPPPTRSHKSAFSRRAQALLRELSDDSDDNSGDESSGRDTSQHTSQASEAESGIQRVSESDRTST